MTRFLDTAMLPAREAKNILTGINDPSNRRWRVRDVDGVGFKPHSLEIEYTLPNGALLMVHRDGWLRLNTQGAAITGTDTYALSVTAEADDGAATFTDSAGVVLERGMGTQISHTMTVKMAEFAPTWTPATLSPAFWLRPSDLTTHTAAPSGELTPDVSRRTSTVAGMDSAFGALSIAPAVTPSTGDYPKVELTTQSLCPRPGNRLTFSTPIAARTVMFVAHVQRNAGWEGSRVISTASNAIEIEESSREIVISGATGSVRVNARAASTQPAYGFQWAIVVARLDSAATWEAISGNAVHIRDMVVVAGSVSDADAERYEGWVAHEYDMAHLLPRNHPYRYGPPGDETPATEPTPWPAMPLEFGSRTKAGMGGVPVPYLTAQTISAGNSAGHWEIAEGRLRPTAAFDTANPAAGTSYSLTISGETVTIDIVADSGRPRLDVCDTSELLRAFGEVRTNSGEGVAGATIVMRSEGRCEGFANYDMNNQAATSLHIKPETPGGVVSGPFVFSGATDCILYDWEAHWRYYRGFDTSASVVRVIQMANGRVERCTARGWYLDWGIGFGGTSDNFATRQYRVLNGMLADEIYYSEIYNADVLATADVYWSNKSGNCLGDGPSTGSTSFTMRDNLFLDNPYKSGQAEGGKHSDMLGQCREEPEEIDIQRNILVANSPLLAAATAGDSASQRGFFAESGSAAHTPFQQNGIIANNVIALRIDAAAIDINPKAGAGLLAQENTISNREGAGVAAWQGERNAIGAQSNPTDVRITDENRADAFALTALPSDRVTTRADVLAYVTPVASGPLDLGSGVTVGAVNLDGTLKAPLVGLPPREPVEVTATASGAGIKVANIALNPTPNGTISEYALAYVRERTPGAGQFFRSRHSMDPTNRRKFMWRLSTSANGDGLIEEGSWTIVSPYTEDNVVPVGGNNSYRVAIQQRNEHGWSPWSEATTTVAVGETPPVFETAPSVIAVSGGVSVTWGTPLASGLTVTQTDLRWALAPTGSWTEITDVTAPRVILTPAQEVEVQVRAITSAGTGAWSEAGSAVALPSSALVIEEAVFNTAASNVSTQTFDIPTLSAAAGQTVLFAFAWWSTTARSLNTITFSRQDGSETVSGAQIMTPITVTGGTMASNFRKTVVAATAPAAGWTDVRVQMVFAGAVRAVPVGGAVVLDASVNVVDAWPAAGNATWAADPAATVTMREGEAIVFGRAQAAGAAVAITDYEVTQEADGDKLLFIGLNDVSAGSATVTADLTPNGTTANDAAGIIVLSAAPL